MMQTATTKGIRVSVEVMYQPAYSKPLRQEFVYAYRITIENLRTFPVQLLRRHWHIWDSAHLWREVEGEGVVGEQPIILPETAYQYVSGCHLHSEIGEMHGFFTMLQPQDDTTFEVQVPHFQLVAPFKYN